MAADPPGRRRRRIVSIVGTRPEAIKMAPVVRALAARTRLDQEVVLTGQHRRLAVHFEDSGAPVRELAYDPAGRTAPNLRESLHRLLCGHFRREPVDLVLVQGDTTSALAATFAARDCAIPVGHVEAGLRSFDLEQPWPEEGNRIVIDAMSGLLFAPTEAAAANLRCEWRTKGEVFVTGNTGIDALLHARRRIGAVTRSEDVRSILVTCHRRENQGAPTRSICAALKRIADELPVRLVVVLHPNRHARKEMEEALADTEGIELREPVAYEEMVRLMCRSWLILTDSGGLQEEAPALGIPVLVLRNVTERGEALECGSIELVGTETGTIFAAVAALLGDSEKHAGMSRPSFPFGDGRAGERIAGAIEQWLAERASRRRA
jgi:UDP-N-acetylglucosamine 2-epimerase (non-hydrolysing)